MFRRLILPTSFALLACGAPTGQVRPAEAVAPLAPQTIAFAQSGPALPGVTAARTETNGDEVTLYDAVWLGGTVTLRAAEIRIEGLRGVGGEVEADRITARDLTMARADGDPDGPQIRLASVTLTGFAASGACGERAPLACARWTLLAATDAAATAGGAHWQAGLLTVADFAGGRVGLVRAESVSADRPAPGAMPPVMAVVARLVGAPMGLAGLAEADALRIDAVSLADADLEALLAGEATWAAEEFRLARPRLSRGGRPLSQARSIVLRDAVVTKGVAMRLTADIEDARADVGAALGAPAEAAARAEGLNALRGQARLRFLREGDEAELNASWRLADEADGRVFLSFAGDPATKIVSGRIELRDTGALDGLFAVAGAAQGQDAGMMRRQVVGGVTLLALDAARDDPRAEAAVRAMLAFAQEGGRLEVLLRPPEPAPVFALGANPAHLVPRLGLTATATRP